MNIKHIVNLKGLGSKTGIASLALLALLGIGMICPMVGEDSSALESAQSNMLLASTSVEVHPMISIGMDTNRFEMDLTPKSGGVSEVKAATLTINTNNTSGYKVYMHTADGSGSLRSMTEDAMIKPVTDNSKLANFGDNTWGYYLGTEDVSDTTKDTLLYHPVPASSTNAIIKDQPTVTMDTETYNLAIATKVSTSLPAGTYNNVLVISAITNPVEITSMDQLFFMQDITPELCANATLEQQRQLVDTRDGKSYWVAKLADGNCWMTQNLALDITDAGLSASDTDIKEDWNSSSTYPPVETETALLKGAGFSNTRSWNLGKYVISNPEYANRCVQEGSSDYISVPTGGTMAQCAASGLIDVSGAEWKPTFKAQWGGWSYSGDYNSLNNGISAKPGAPATYFIAVNTETHEYDPHYLVGNYYMFNTAAAGQGMVDSANTNVDVSICPKGWRLPIGGAAENDKNGSVFNMLNAYGLTNTNPSTGGTYVVTLPNGDTQEYTVDQNKYGLIFSPLSFIRSGQVYVYDSGNYTAMRWIGGTGMFWTNTVSTTSANSTNGYYYEFTYAGVKLNSSAEIHFGFPVRCLSR